MAFLPWVLAACVFVHIFKVGQVLHMGVGEEAVTEPRETVDDAAVAGSAHDKYEHEEEEDEKAAPAPERLAYVGVISAPPYFHKRDKIRTTFMSLLREQFGTNGLVWAEFLVGHEPYNLASRGPPYRATDCQRLLEERLMRESQTYGDIYRLPLPERYSRLPDKTLQVFMRGVELGYKYVMKSDDDWKVKVPYLVKLLKDRIPEDLFYSGTAFWAKRADASQIPRTGTFVPYFGGRGYLLSWGLAWRIAVESAWDSCAYLSYGMSSEDVVTGMWVHRVAEKSGLKLKTKEKFMTVELPHDELGDSTIRVSLQPNLCLSLREGESDDEAEAPKFLATKECRVNVISKTMPFPDWNRSQLHLDADGILWTMQDDHRCVHAAKSPDGSPYFGSCEPLERANPTHIRRCSDGTLRLQSDLRFCLGANRNALKDPHANVSFVRCSNSSGVLQRFELRRWQPITKAALKKALEVIPGQHYGDEKDKSCLLKEWYGRPSYHHSEEPEPHQVSVPCPDSLEVEPPRNPMHSNFVPGTVPPREPRKGRLLYMGVVSLPRSFKLRARLREVHRELLHTPSVAAKVRMEFIVGHEEFSHNHQGAKATDEQGSVEDQLREEQDKHGDIWRIPLSDAPAHLPDKVLFLLARGTELRYRFIMKSDESQLLHVEAIKNLVARRSWKDLLYAGGIPCGVLPTQRPERQPGIRQSYMASYPDLWHRLQGFIKSFTQDRDPSTTSTTTTIDKRCPEDDVVHFRSPAQLVSWSLAHRIAKISITHSASFMGYGSSDVEVDMGHWVAWEASQGSPVEYVQARLAKPLPGDEFWAENSSKSGPDQESD